MTYLPIRPPRNYDNPPVVELAFEMRYLDSVDVSAFLTLLGALKESFPTVEEGASAAPEPSKSDRPPSYLLTNPTRTIVCQVGRGFISVSLAPSATGPYQGFSSLRPSIVDALKSLFDVPAQLSFSRLGLRYVDVIRLPERAPVLTDYFSFHPTAPPLTTIPREDGYEWKWTDFNLDLSLSFQKGHDAADGERMPGDLDRSLHLVMKTTMQWTTPCRRTWASPHPACPPAPSAALARRAPLPPPRRW